MPRGRQLVPLFIRFCMITECLHELTEKGLSFRRARRPTDLTRLVRDLYAKQLPNSKIPSDQISRSVMSGSLWPHESQHARPPCLSPAPGVHSDSCPSSQWCHPAISSSVIPFSSCPKSLPASESFPMSQLFAWDGQRIGASASASFLPMNAWDWSPLEWTGWISLQSKGLSRVFSNTQFKSINSSVLSFLHSPTLTSIHDHRKKHSLD